MVELAGLLSRAGGARMAGVGVEKGAMTTAPMTGYCPMGWPEAWREVDEVTAAAFEAELRNELSLAHPLFGLPLKAVGRRWGCPEVLFEMGDGSRRVAVVRLTWSGTLEEPPYPDTTIYE